MKYTKWYVTLSAWLEYEAHKMSKIWDVTARDVRRICDGAAAMSEACSLEAAALAMVDTVMDLVPCDHAGYAEVDGYLGRNRVYSSEPEISAWVERRSEDWSRHMSEHPIYAYRKQHPNTETIRLSDVAELSDFYSSEIYNTLFREVQTDHQLVMHLGFDPGGGPDSGVLPLALGVPLNRSRRDFTDRDKDVLRLFRFVARPILIERRQTHMHRLLAASDYTAEIARNLMAFGLTARQAEVSFWMLKGKSNTDIGTILDVGAQTVRQHSMAIFRKLGVSGRLMLQRTVLSSMSGYDVPRH